MHDGTVEAHADKKPIGANPRQRRCGGADRIAWAKYTFIGGTRTTTSTRSIAPKGTGLAPTAREVEGRRSKRSATCGWATVSGEGRNRPLKAPRTPARTRRWRTSWRCRRASIGARGSSQARRSIRCSGSARDGQRDALTPLCFAEIAGKKKEKEKEERAAGWTRS